MDEQRSTSPPLPPDPYPAMRKVQAFQEPFVAPSPLLQAQQQPLPADLNRSNTSRSRASSRAAPMGMHQPQPIKDAVNNAFVHSPVAQNQNQLDQEELIRQVTEQVIKSLQATNMAGPIPTGSVQPQQSRVVPPSPAQAQTSHVPWSPTQSSTDSVPRRDTPPSLEKQHEREGYGYGSSSPDLVQSDHDSVYSRESVRSKASTRSQVRTRPLPTDGTEEPKRNFTTSSRPVASNEDMHKRRGSGSGSTAREPSHSVRRDSRSSDSEYYEAPSSRSKVAPPDVVNEITTLERIWQPLFDNGNPTVRLGQFLRGLAMHLVDDYEPKGSLVVTPAKMLRFFGEVKVADEAYPWDVVFGGKLSSNSLSKMYQKLLCQHHLVQVQNHEAPTVPGLTPSGFEQLMTVLLQAHPDTEFERLARAVMNMPISNADNKSERFPKELSRRLLPAHGNLQAEQRIVASLNHEPILVQLRGSSSMPPPPPASTHPPQTSFPLPQTSFTERERKPYAQTSFSNTVDDDDLLGQPAAPIERERMPYFAKEGMGKMHNANEDRERDNRPPTSYKPDPPPTRRRSSRSNSNVPTYNNNASEPVSVPPAKNHRTSVDRGPPPAMFNTNAMNGMNGSVPKSGRSTPPPQAGRRTPPPRNFARSEPVDINGISSSEYRSNLHSSYQPSTRDRYAGGESDDDSRRRHRSRRATDRSGNHAIPGNSNEDDASGGRGYPIPPRQPPSTQQGYESSYNAGPPVGSYARGGGMDARRNTWYGANNMAPNLPTGGSDGYGSFGGNGGGGGGGYTAQQPYGSSAQQH
ncbi:hypothetical protein LTR08_000897 [Meristemomyces frigidus]|nr:hypothetical protein LTR08_000897 [Meristemomyces frigidus]